MKIGILTFHRALNYGAVLQCYALQEYLKSKGHELEILDYRPNYIEKYRKAYYKKDLIGLSFRQKLAYFLFLPFNYLFKKKASRSFDSFLSNYFNLSSPFYGLTNVPSGYDMIFFGSDQIWSPQICEGFDPVFWGCFEKKDANFITYAASLGGHNKLSFSDWGVVKKYIDNYDAISVREIELQKALETHLSLSVPVVVDPTLLVGRTIFDSIAKKPKEDKYVLLFTLESNNDALNLAQRIAEEKQCEVIRISAISNVFNPKGVKNVCSITPGEFCGYIKYATFVVTISFHGTAFSVLFNKDFYTLHSKQEDRAFNLLKSVGLEERMVYVKDVKKVEGCNHAMTDERIVQLREVSEEYIRKALGE